MRIPLTPRHALAAAFVALLALSGPANTAGADDAGRPAQPLAEQPVPARVFPEVPGVDLRGLGYRGPWLDAEVLERLTSPLPEEPRHRVMEIGGRTEEIPPLLDGLREAEGLLAAVVAELGPAVDDQRAAVSVAEQRQAEAERRVQEAERRVLTRARALDQHRRDMAEVAVAAYVNPPDADTLGAVLGGAATTSDDLTAGVLFSAKTEHDGIVEDDLEVSIAVANERRAQTVLVAEDAAARTVAARSDLAALTARLEAHQAAHSVVGAMVTTLDAALPALEADLHATIEKAWGNIGELAGISVVDVPVVVVDGIRIHAALAPRLQALLDTAHAAGVPLGGWGYRSVDQQIALRKAHCGPSPEDVYLKPASACSPPTAQPGSSMHERGLAVDFHLAGRSITSHDDPGYQWLAANAATFGFQNLPSEPWHWSVNGQ